MKTHNTFSILFYIKKYKSKNGQAPLYCRITINGERSEIFTDEYIRPKVWDSKKQKVKGVSQEAQDLAQTILDIKTALYKYKDEFEREGKILSALNIKRAYKKLDKKCTGFIEIAQSFYAFIHSEMGQTYEWGTVKNYDTTIKFLKEFILSKYGVADIDIKQIERSFITEFKRMVTSPKRKIICKQNGFAKHYQRIKKIIHWAIENDFLERDPFLGHPEKIKEVTNIFLTEAELEKLKDFNLETDAESRIRDVFIFCCYTGLSFSDMIGLTRNDIHLHIDNRRWILIKRKKSNTDSKIPMLSIASAFLDKYLIGQKETFDGKIFPQVTNQYFNRELKAILLKCGISKHITCHKARHTFGTTICANNNVPIDTCAEILGHKSLRITRRYYQTTPFKIGNDINELEKRLSQIAESNSLKLHDKNEIMVANQL